MEFNPLSLNHWRVPTYSRFAKTPSLVAIGEAIRRMRNAQEVAQDELALRSGMDRSYLGGIERGESNVTLLNIVKIAEALGIRASELLDHAGL